MIRAHDVARGPCQQYVSIRQFSCCLRTSAGCSPEPKPGMTSYSRRHPRTEPLSVKGEKGCRAAVTGGEAHTSVYTRSACDFELPLQPHRAKPAGPGDPRGRLLEGWRRPAFSCPLSCVLHVQKQRRELLWGWRRRRSSLLKCTNDISSLCILGYSPFSLCEGGKQSTLSDLLKSISALRFKINTENHVRF